MAEFTRRVPKWNSHLPLNCGGGFVMATPRKSKTAGVRTGKSNAKAASNGSTETPMAAPAPATNGNGGGAPSAEMIRLRAYEVFVARGGTAGDELSDWLVAEREIMERFATHD